MLDAYTNIIATNTQKSKLPKCLKIIMFDLNNTEIYLIPIR